MPHYPAARLLVPADAPGIPDSFTPLLAPIVNGLPHVIELPNQFRLTISLPTGLLAHWLGADPKAVVSNSDDEASPFQPQAAAATGNADRPALRMTARQARVPLGTVPLALQGDRVFRTNGDGATGPLLEVLLLGWMIHAGTVCGVGDFGSYVSFAWRRADQAIQVFGPPVVNPFLVLRLPLSLRIQSQLGLRPVSSILQFNTRRLVIDERA